MSKPQKPSLREAAEMAVDVLTNLGYDPVDLREALAEQAEQEPVALHALKVAVKHYDMESSFYGGGCEHGFKPAKACPNKDCEEAELQKLIEMALEATPQPVQEPFLEVFCDPSYFDMWCVRDVHYKDYNHTIHVNSKESANHAKSLIESWIRTYTTTVRTKDLTDDEIFKTNKTELPDCQDLVDFARAVIAADREKNK